MRILGAAGKRRIVGLVDCRLEQAAEILPAVAKLDLARPAEHAVGKFAGAKAGEANELLLLLPHRRPILLLDLPGDKDGGNIRFRTLLPAGRKTTALVLEVEILADALFAHGLPCRRDRQRRGGGGRRRIRLVVVGGEGLVSTKGRGAHAKPKAETERQRGVAEHVEGEGIVAHRDLLVSGCAPSSRGNGVPAGEGVCEGTRGFSGLRRSDVLPSSDPFVHGPQPASRAAGQGPLQRPRLPLTGRTRMREGVFPFSFSFSVFLSGQRN